ncbi:hypothetical protein [Paenibacillus sp. LHD-38]|uniref:hypothetical protein n=1 Tax=Paenibacillus sp. LHD-38 TaxID=3072143 RepID=UPI00280F788F|nr:hypothetical protein [Paenibacillus sp. LHD-38]MDQ8734288.1 hypothetical protein [Paenibacillus sp. LHD-38]
MSRWFRSGLAVVALLLWLSPAQVSAYSYGDANTEDVAETFKIIVGAASGNKPDWKVVEETHKVRRSEIKSHFGESVAVTLDKNIEAKDSKLLTANYKAVLVMNLDRRFTYALKDVSDYAGAKLLLAKAKATFDTLAPYMSSGTDDINGAFEEALEALGNPGLFGVGEKEVDPETFKQKVNFIYGKVKPQFPYKAYVKPPVAKPNEEKSVKEPAATQKPSPTKAPTAAVKPSPSVKPSPAQEEEAAASPTPSTALSPDPEELASASPEAEPTSEVPVTEETGGETATSAESGSEDASEQVLEEPISSDGAVAASEQAAQEEGHSPMERTDKTNSLVTVFVIAGVIIVGAGVIWFIRKKGLM